MRVLTLWTRFSAVSTPSTRYNTLPWWKISIVGSPATLYRALRLGHFSVSTAKTCTWSPISSRTVRSSFLMSLHGPQNRVWNETSTGLSWQCWSISSKFLNLTAAPRAVDGLYPLLCSRFIDLLTPAEVSGSVSRSCIVSVPYKLPLLRRYPTTWEDWHSWWSLGKAETGKTKKPIARQSIRYAIWDIYR